MLSNCNVVQMAIFIAATPDMSERTKMDEIWPMSIATVSRKCATMMALNWIEPFNPKADFYRETITEQREKKRTTYHFDRTLNMRFSVYTHKTWETIIVNYKIQVTLNAYAL